MFGSSTPIQQVFEKKLGISVLGFLGSCFRILGSVKMWKEAWCDFEGQPQHLKNIIKVGSCEVERQKGNGGCAGILMDAFALAKAGIMPTTQTLDLALSYRNEPE